MKKSLSLLVFLGLVIGGGLTIGYLTRPGEWYATLTKPSFTPPGWVFGPAWLILYVCIGVSGWKVWQRYSDSLSMKLWWAQLALNFLWSPVFFVSHQIGLALVVILLLLAVIIAFIAVTWRTAQLASLLFIPYAAWVAFASLLNGSIFLLN